MQVLWACWAPPLEIGKLAGFCYAGEFVSLSYTSCLVVLSSPHNICGLLSLLLFVLVLLFFVRCFAAIFSAN